jgi:hypothetical protein
MLCSLKYKHLVYRSCSPRREGESKEDTPYQLSTASSMKEGLELNRSTCDFLEINRIRLSQKYSHLRFEKSVDFREIREIKQEEESLDPEESA